MSFVTDLNHDVRRLVVATKAGRSLAEGSRSLRRRARRAVGLSAVPKLDPHLAGMERVFRLPPLTPELVAAVKLIAPHLDLEPIEEHRAVWEADHNGACWDEYEALQPVFDAMPKPRKVLEIGPGMGRSLVFFSKKLGWDNTELHAYEGEGKATKYTMRGPRSQDSFCGNINVLQQMLRFNGVNTRVFNAREVDLRKLPGPYDLVYSFYAVGYHWSLEHFLYDILAVMAAGGTGIFTVPPNFRPFPALGDLDYRIIDWKPVWPKNAHLKLLVLSKSGIW
jgi:hypothetical protein